MTRQIDTPIERHGGYLVKRDDLYVGPGGATGGKARTVAELCRQANRENARGVVSAGGRFSVQNEIVARVATALGLDVRIHTAVGEDTDDLRRARAAGAEIVAWHPGYQSVITKRARDDAAARRWFFIPPGLECREATVWTAMASGNLPFGEFSRIVVPVGSGMTLAGVLVGVRARDSRIPVLGVVVGADPKERLERYAPLFAEYELVRFGGSYDRPPPITRLGPDLELDPLYEAKCLPFLRKGDLLWVVGRRSGLPA